MLVKKKLRDVTKEKFIKWRENCDGECKNCKFRRVECDYDSKFCWIYQKDLYSDKFLDQEIEIEVERPKPTKEAISLLKLLNPNWEWIVKEPNGDIYLHILKPNKSVDFWNSGTADVLQTHLFNFKFDFLSWGDEEPTNIQELIKEYENEM